MSSFTIETDGSFIGARQYVPDWMADGCDVGTPDSTIVNLYGQHLMGAVFNPKTQATVIKHVLANWAFLHELGKENPHLFNEFWTAYAERIWDAEAT